MNRPDGIRESSPLDPQGPVDLWTSPSDQFALLRATEQVIECLGDTGGQPTTLPESGGEHSGPGGHGRTASQD